MIYSTTPGWATTIKTIVAIPKNAYDSVMTIQSSPLRNLDPITAHMMFQVLAFIWSGLFAAILGSIFAFGISVVAHILFISGITITAITFRTANTSPQALTKTNFKYNGRAANGEHV